MWVVGGRTKGGRSPPRAYTVFTLVAIAVAVAYLLAGAGYLLVVLGDKERLSPLALGALIVALAGHVVALSIVVANDGFGGLGSIQRSLSVLALLIGVGFVTTKKFSSLGAVVVPFLFLLQCASVLAEPGAAVPEEIRGPLLTVHVALSLLGTAAFALATMSAALYLIQERNLKKKKFGPMFNRLPSVTVLDRISLRFITVGFPIYTLALGLGAFFAWKHGAQGAEFQIQYPFAVTTWLIYAGIIHARYTTGWRGRRAAYLTIAGLVGLATVLAIYLLRG